MQNRPNRQTIVSDVFNFPSDLYIFQGIINMFKDKPGNPQHRLELVPSRDTITIHIEDVEAALTSDVAFISLSHVAFKSAFKYDINQVTTLAHKAGALTLWDLSHSVGVVPLKLNQWNVDLAIGCTYKYLNGGPGSPAFLFIREDLQQELISPIWGWFAAESPFEFSHHFKPARNISRFRIGTPPMLSMKAIEPSVDILLEAGIDKIWEKSVTQTSYLIYLASKWLLPVGFRIGSPINPNDRGSHISIRHPNAYQICQAMIQSDPPNVRIIPDFREPNNIRLGIAPIYTTYSDIHRAMDRIRTIAEEKVYLSHSSKRTGVT
jgi:kynureninase